MNSLGLVYHWFCRAIEGSVTVNISSCKIRAFQPEKEEELSFMFIRWPTTVTATGNYSQQ